MRLIPTQSSSLAGIAYELEAPYFYAQFVNGAVYRYDIGSESGAQAVISAVLFSESQGKAFNDLVKGGLFKYEKVEGDELIRLDLHV